MDPSLAAELLCPITHEAMADPVVAADGNTYERAALEGEQAWGPGTERIPVAGCTVQSLQPESNQSVQACPARLPWYLPPCPAAAAWIARQQAEGRAPCSPLTGLPLAHLFLAPNRALRTLSAGLQAAGLLQ